LGEVTDEHVAFVRSQLVSVIEQIESLFDMEIDMARLEKAVTLSSRASTLWREVLETARNHPASITFWDGLIHMSPVILMRGSQKAVDYYELLLAEMKERNRSGLGAIPGERHRIYWEGMPVWPKIRELSERFFDSQAVIAASTYCNSWAFEDYDGGDPLEWMARTSTEIFINRDEVAKEAFLLDMFDQFDIDGAIFHNTALA
jgi:benzoyl-CoA reductase/2-hydroxyglutaryl-CoA dehydratase subunit BcrC/BadD/HgdB